MQINDLVKAAKHGQSPTQITFSNEEKDSTYYLFMRMTGVWGMSKMNSLYPDEAAQQIARRTFAKRIGKYTREQIDASINFMSEQKSNAKMYDWPDVNEVLGCLRDLNRTRPLHQKYVPMLTHHVDEGYVQDHLLNLKKMFD